MSLHELANHLQTAGRGEDKILVHMTPAEVGGLQTLAEKHGGSLTVNPHTGLPEAGFLSAILPMIAGAALAPFTGGMSAALMVGAGDAAITGSLSKGLMAGLGAFGGAGLASGLSTVGEVAGAANSAMSGADVAANLGQQTFNAIPAEGATAANLTSSAPQASSLLSSGSPAASSYANMGEGLKTLTNPNGFSDLYDALPKGTLPATAAAMLAAQQQPGTGAVKGNQGMIRPYTYSANPTGADLQPYSGSAERTYFNPVFTAGTPYTAPGPEYKKASGGLTALAVGGPVEQMSAQNAVGANQMYPQAGLQTSMYSNPETQRPMSVNVLSPESDVAVDPYTGEQKFAMGGGISSLGSYSDGGHLLKGPGDGVSDSIPAEIGGHQPARLAEGEFVIPARIVSELGNGSTDAGAKRLYAMMDRVQKARGKTVGKNKVAVDSKAVNQLPA